MTTPGCSTVKPPRRSACAQAHQLGISDLPDDGPSAPIVMAIGHMWLLGRPRYDRGWHTTCVYKEGWHIAAGPSAWLARANQKLSRGLGLSNVFAFHKGTDIPANSPGMAMVQEAPSVYVYPQSRHEDALWCQQTFNVSPERAHDITQLSDGHACAAHPLGVGDADHQHRRGHGRWTVASTPVCCRRSCSPSAPSSP